MVQTAYMLGTQALQYVGDCVELSFGNTYFNYLLGSTVRVGYWIPVQDFYIVLHGLQHQSSPID